MTGRVAGEGLKFWKRPASFEEAGRFRLRVYWTDTSSMRNDVGSVMSLVPRN